MRGIKQIEKIPVSLPSAASVVKPDQEKGQKHRQMRQRRFQAIGSAASAEHEIQKLREQEQKRGFDHQKEPVPAQERDYDDQKHAPPGIIRFQSQAASMAAAGTRIAAAFSITRALPGAPGMRLWSASAPQRARRPMRSVQKTFWLRGFHPPKKSRSKGSSDKRQTQKAGAHKRAGSSYGYILPRAGNRRSERKRAR